MASAAVEKRQYLVRLVFMGLARNSSAGALIERHAFSQSRYSYLNSFNVIARSVAGSRTPRCASSMIFGQRDVLRQTALRWGPNTSVASRTHWISLGDLRRRRRNDRGCAGVSFMRAFRPPCQRTGAPVRDSQWPGRRNLPRRGTPRRAPVRADEPNDNDLTYVQVTCLACAQAHLVNPKTREVLGAEDEKTRGALCAHTTRAKIIRSRRPFRFVLESGARGSFS